MRLWRCPHCGTIFLREDVSDFLCWCNNEGRPVEAKDAIVKFLFGEEGPPAE